MGRVGAGRMATTTKMVPNVAFRELSAFPELEKAATQTTLHDVIAAGDPRPTVIHMFDSG